MPFSKLPHAIDAYVQVAVDSKRSLVRLTRTALRIPLSNVHELMAVFASEMASVLPCGARAKQRLLFDIRDGPKIADSNLESALMSVFYELMKDFNRLAILLRTPVGVLQTRRLARIGGLHAEVFFDEAEALLYLTRGD